MKRTGSMYSRVPPAETTSTRPFNGPLRPSAARMASSNTAVSGNRPLPSAPDAIRPLSGSITRTPRRRSVARLSCVAGLAYMAGSMAGATTMGAWVDSAVAEPRSSACPCASRAIALAVAGATTRTSASFASLTCAISLSAVIAASAEYTVRCVSAWKVSGPTKSAAARDSTASTSAPACVSLLARSEAL